MLIQFLVLILAHGGHASRFLRPLTSPKSVRIDQQKSDHRVNKNILSVATFNTYWLVDPVLQRLQKAPKFSPWTTPEQARDHIRDVALVLGEVAADVVVLTEIQCQHALDLLTNDLNDQMRRREGVEYKAFMLPEVNEETGMNVALLSTVDPVGPLRRFNGCILASSTCLSKGHLSTAIVNKRPFQTDSGRDFCCDFELYDGSGRLHKFTLFGVHFKLLRTNVQRGILLRAAQSRILTSAINNCHSLGREAIVAGDFNDVDARLSAPPRNTHSNSVEIVCQGADGMWNPASLVPTEKRYSCKSGLLIDHVLVAKRRPVETVQIYHEAHNGPSDHYAVKAELDLTRDRS